MSDPRRASLSALVAHQVALRVASPGVDAAEASRLAGLQATAFRYLSRGLSVPPHVQAGLEEHLEVAAKTQVLRAETKGGEGAKKRGPSSALPLHWPHFEEPPLAKTESVLRSRLQNRLEELQRFPLDAELGEEDVRALQIETGSLMAFHVQKSVRQQVLQTRRNAAALALANPARYDLPRPTLVEPVPASADISQEMRAEALDQIARQQQEMLLDAIWEHRKSLLASFAAQKKTRAKICRAVMDFHERRLRAERERKNAAERARIQLLKENNEEAYRQLVEETKNERLKSLLDQTDAYLAEVGQILKNEKAKEDAAAGRTPVAIPAAAAAPVSVPVAMEEEGGGGGEEEEGGEEKGGSSGGGEEDEEAAEDLEAARKSINYYENIHSIKETVTGQSKSLVGGTLKGYQIAGLEWLVSLYNNGLNGILADEMGLGKTIQTLSLVTYLIDVKKVPGPFLIVVPLSTTTNWVNEMTKWCPSVKFVSYKGPQKARRAKMAEMMREPFSVCLTTYTFVVRDANMLSKFKWKYIIIDEGHRVKSKKAKLTVTLTEDYSTERRLILTGTPLQNNLQELWSLLNFLLPSVFGSSGTFEQWFNAPFEKTGESLELNEEETLLIINRLHKVLRPFLLRRLKSEVAKQLPSKVETVLKCDMSAMQKALYNRLKNREVVAAGGPRALNNVLIQLRKVCNHPYLFPDADSKVTNRNIIRACGKFDLLDNLLTKLRILGNRVLLFSQMTQLLTVLEDYLLYRGFAYIRLDGTTRNEDRGRLLKMYNAKDSPYFVFLLSTRAGGLGLNLQAADTVILFDSDWNPHADLQAQDRAHRIGQKTQVRIFRLITQNSVEEHILARALEKLEMDAMVIGAGKFNQKSSAEERREMLRQILAEDIGDRAPDDLPTSSEINQLIARSEAQFQLFERMDKEDEERRKLIAMRNPDDIEGFPPLMTEEEIPTWLKKETLIKEREARAREMEVSLGKGKRSRTEVIYNDGLSDDKFAELLDAGLTEAEIQQYVIQKRERAKKRKRRGRGGAADDDDDDHEEEEEDHDMMVLKRRSSRSRGSASAGPRAKKSRGLGRGLSRGRSGVEEEEDEEEEEEDRSWHGQAKEVIAQLRELTAVDEEGYERRLMDPFEKLPSKTDYPDYYAYISDPRAFSQVTRKISRSKYPGYEAFVEDVRLIFANAMSYNREDSLIYQDASVLLGSFEDMKQQ